MWFDIRVVAEGLRDGPDSLCSIPAVIERSLCKFVHARADVFELALAVVAATVSVIWCANGTAVTTRSLDLYSRLGGRHLLPLTGECDIVPDHVSILHQNICARTVLRPVVVLAIPVKILDRVT